MPGVEGDPNEGEDVRVDVEAVLLATRALVGISARALAVLDDTDVTLPQFRMMVLIASRGPMHLAAVARELGVHPSNTTRAWDRLRALGMVVSRPDPLDRRSSRLELTEKGQQLVELVQSTRRTAIAEVLDRLSPLHRVAIGMALMAFAEAAGEVTEADLRRLGWVGPRTPPD